MPDRLFLLDGMALVYRAHFAFLRNPIVNSRGENTSALFGFANTLVDLLANQKPTHIAVAFDTRAPTVRHAEFPAYKAQREAMPEDLANAIPQVKRLVEAFKIPVLEADGFEADDIIGTLAKRAAAEGIEVFMVTPDKDFGQLVGDRVKIYKPGRKGGEVELLGPDEIRERWGIERSEQVTDMLGLMGDTSDNIPGVPGVGEKTAAKLVREFGSLEGLLGQTASLKGKLKENLEAHRDQALLSKKLATILLDAPVEVGWDELAVEPPDDDAVKDLLVEFEFNGIGRRLYGEGFKAGRGAPAARETDGAGGVVLKKLADIPHDYRVVATAREAGELAAALLAQPAWCFDTETSSLDPKVATVVGVAFSWEKGAGWYADTTIPGVLDALRPAFAREGIEKAGHNLKFDLAILHWNGVEVAGPFFDTMLVHSLVEPEQRHGMDYLSERYLGYSPVPIESLIGTGTGGDGQLSMLEVTGERRAELADYAAEDADVTWQLAGVLRPLLAQGGQANVYHDIESPLLPVLVRMEAAGIAIDTHALAEIGSQLGKRIAELDALVQQQAGTRFNVNSPKQIGQVFFDILKLVEKPKKTKTGQYKTDEATLVALAPYHRIVRDLLDYREAAKLKNTYVDTLPGTVCPRTGRVHTTYHQLMAATGRLASSNPNLQNIPVRTAQGREIRKAFVSGKPGNVLLSADYSQVELRIMASISKDPAMVEAFEAGLDIHVATAARVYEIDPHDVLPEMRRTAKMVNFGIIYGISAFGLSQRLGIPKSEASHIIDAYFERYPGVRHYMDSTIAKARESGYVETLTGRRRYLRDINSANANVRGNAERMAINTPIQGTAADMIKLAMVRVDASLQTGRHNAQLLLQVHDELVLECPEPELDTVRPLVVNGMQGALPLDVPVVVDTGTGPNWLEAH